ncbi:hypothetical protein TELCIR_01671 [Teladorsagia circumcincta]|uniref:Uncharacterized protein n=1 Tax=Teladorsagia circumcincta TaxID=45464 RepID=A0A2G9V1C5_TELCI|nr:hypothetical protein TELCIR_01671 [Teladorsagia circumcincta]
MLQEKNSVAKRTEKKNVLEKVEVDRREELCRILVSITQLNIVVLFGLCNNYGYVIMLSAAEDIMDIQKGHNKTESLSQCEV